ncbi:MAG: hypothetical protein PHO02_04040 [Candidatus Nanoarchaeia archaeon]|nr:hypothetical protein [Candidatus Nanoarchaeia archaeon]
MIKKAILGIGAALSLGCASMGVPRVPSLDCDDLIETEKHGTVFYSCRQDTTDTVLEMFDLIGRVKEYGKNTLGFSETVNYRQYVNTDREEPRWSYRIYIAPRDSISLEPADEVFLPYSQNYREDIDEPLMLWSRNDNLLDEEAYYNENGYDTYRRALTNFSPGATITPEFILLPAERQIDVVTHEDWHYNINQVWGNDLDNDLEEALATIMGKAGALDFITINYGRDSAAYGSALGNLFRWIDVSETINTSYSLLENLYSQNLPWEQEEPIKQEILARADEWYFAPLNNAKIVGFLPYTRLFPLVYNVYVTHPDAGELGRILMQCPDDEEDGIEFLRRARYMSAKQR